MKKNINQNLILLVYILLFSTSVFAQKKLISEHNHKADEISHYKKLKSLGYADKEIFQDLGNANFLLEKYDKAVFWYKKLIDLQNSNPLKSSYQKRYQFALEQTTTRTTENFTNDNDWLAQIRADYQLKRNFEQRKEELSSNEMFRELDFQPNLRSQSLTYLVEYERNKAFELNQIKGKNKQSYPDYEEPIAITADGKTAYFSKAVYMKPLEGIFSKKELVYKIYRTDKIFGEWKNVREVTLAPKYYSAKHPAISKDGKRLFFTSNMPGTFGDYDIYAADINAQGIAGQAKNLGTKVNTKQNELYPNILEDNTLVFSSEGRSGYGGLDLYMSHVSKNKVKLATNLGSPINSNKDDFSLVLIAEKGIGYVLSNRGENKNKIQQVAFSYDNPRESLEEKDQDLLNNLSDKLIIDYSTTIFENK